MQNLSSKKIAGYIRNINREFGAIGEVMDTFALHKASSTIEREMNRNIGNLKVKQTGSAQTVDVGGKIAGTGTTDALFTYTGSYDGDNSVNFNFGVSLKTTGTVIDENGKWVQREAIADIKIKSISAKYRLWNDIFSALGSKSTLM